MTTKIRLLHDTVGIPTGAVAVTQSASDNTTKVATTAYVTTALANLADSAPSTLNTLNELAAALGDDANFSTTVTNSIATKAPLATPQFTNRVGIGVAAHGTAALNITSTAQHMRLNNGSELGIISLLSTGELELWGHGDGESINFRTGSGTGTVAMNVVGNNVGIGTTAPEKNLSIGSSHAEGIQFNFDTTNNYRNQILNYWNSSADSRMDFNVARASGATPSTIMSVGYNSNVGIGTTSPQAELDVRGNMTLVNGSPDIYIGTTSASHYNWRIAAQEVVDTGFEIAVGTQSAGSSAASDTYATKFVLMANGRCGIGTTNPSAKLHVANAATEEYIFETTSNNTRSQVEVKSKDSSGNAVQTRIASMGDGVYGMLYTLTNHNLTFATNNAAPQMTLDTSGKVIIGDTASHVDDLLQIESPASGGGHGIQIRRNDSNGDQGIGRIMFGNNNDTDLATISSVTDGQADCARLVFSTQPTSGNSTERMRITSAGNVGIGETVPQTSLHVKSGDSGGTVYNAGYNPIVIEGSSHCGLQILTPNTHNGLIYFGDNNSAVSGRIEYQHQTDFMQFVTAGAERVRIDADGMKFNGDSAAANALDDYEEGSWTPVLQNVTTSSISHYSLYTKIGRICHIHAKITATVTSLPGANFAISGLPFTVKDSSDSQQRALIAIGGDSQNLGAYANGRAHFRTNGTQLQGVWLNSGSTAYWNYNSMDHTTFEIHLHGHYTV